MNIYIGNLHLSANEDDIQEAFSVYGTVTSVKVVVDRSRGKSRGYAVVEMPNEKEAKRAIKAMNGALLKGRPLRVALAKKVNTTPDKDWLSRLSARPDHNQRIFPNQMDNPPGFRHQLSPFNTPDLPGFLQSNSSRFSATFLIKVRSWNLNSPFNPGNPFSYGRLPGDPTTRPPKPPRPK